MLYLFKKWNKVDILVYGLYTFDYVFNLNIKYSKTIKLVTTTDF